MAYFSVLKCNRGAEKGIGAESLLSFSKIFAIIMMINIGRYTPRSYNVFFVCSLTRRKAAESYINPVFASRRKWLYNANF